MSTATGLSNIDQGAAYVFVEPPGGWLDMTQTATLTASNARRTNQLGFSVYIAGNTVLAGAPAFGGQNGGGGAYVYIKPQGGWVSATETKRLTRLGEQPGDNFGYSVALNGGTSVGAAIFSTEGGAAFLFGQSQQTSWRRPLRHGRPGGLGLLLHHRRTTQVQASGPEEFVVA